MAYLEAYIAQHNLFMVNLIYIGGQMLVVFLACLILFMFLKKVRSLSFGPFAMAAGRKIKKKR